MFFDKIQMNLKFGNDFIVFQIISDISQSLVAKKFNFLSIEVSAIFELLLMFNAMALLFKYL